MDGLTSKQSDEPLFLMPRKFDFVQVGNKTIINTDLMRIQELDEELVTLEGIEFLFGVDWAYIEKISELQNTSNEDISTMVIQIEIEGMDTLTFDELLNYITGAYLLAIYAELELIEEPIEWINYVVVEEIGKTISTFWFNQDTIQIKKRNDMIDVEAIIEVSYEETLFNLSIEYHGIREYEVSLP